MTRLPLHALLACIGTVMPAMVAQAQASVPAFTLEASPEHSAFHVDGAPGVVVHGPEGFDPRAPLHLVVFLHGFSGCARVLMGDGEVACREGGRPRRGWNLAGHHDASGRNTLLLVPQLAFMQRDGRPGCFREPGCFRRFLQELLSGPLSTPLGGPRDVDDVASITLVAHSAGFSAALAILEHGQVDTLVRNVVLMDALYARAPAFARWLVESKAPSPHLLSIYLGRGKTYQHSRALHRQLQRSLGEAQVAHVRRGRAGEDKEHRVLAEALASHSLVIAAGRGGHGRVPHNYLAPVLRALGLPANSR